MGLGFDGCVPTVGIGCAIAIVGGFVSLLGGMAGQAYFGFFEVQPALAAMDSLFRMTDAIEDHSRLKRWVPFAAYVYRRTSINRQRAALLANLT